MFIGDLNVLLILFFILSSTFLISATTSLHMLLTAELLWITLYIIALFIGLINDNLNILSLTFFFLIFSAVEFAIGLVLLMLQHIFLRTVNLTENDYNTYKYHGRFLHKLNSNRVLWKN